MLICVTEPGQSDVCEETSAEDQATFDRLPNANVVVYQSKDDGMTFFRFYQEDPPRYTIVYAPGDDDLEGFADERGFRGNRELVPGWMALGPIPDEDREAMQWT